MCFCFVVFLLVGMAIRKTMRDLDFLEARFRNYLKIATDNDMVGPQKIPTDLEGQELVEAIRQLRIRFGLTWTCWRLDFAII